MTSFIIHFRKDCDDRVFNLRTILRYLHNLAGIAYEIIVVNDDKEIDPIMMMEKPNYPKVRMLFCENDGEFKKAHCFNEAAKVARGEILCFYDVDVLIPFEQILDAITIVTLDNAHVYPFSGVFVDVKKTFFDEFISDDGFDMEKLKKEVTSKELGFFNGNINVISDSSPGGCTMISKDAFDKIGGYDDKFIGWGFEDTDFRERSKKQNKVMYLEGDKYLFHLEHSSHCDKDRSQQPHYVDNYKRFLQNAKG